MLRLRALVVLLVPLALSATVHAKPKPAPPPQGPTFDKEAAAKALQTVELVKCKAPGGPRGEGHATITFNPEGVVGEVKVDRGPYVGSPVAGCIAKQYKAAKVPGFTGQPVTVGKTFRID
jgi:hypothetical protein